MDNGHNACVAFPIPAVEQPNTHATQLIIRKSRFVAQACHCATTEDARKFIACIRAANPQATHNCWAFVAGPPGNTAFIGSSDDGEPHGTAGRPMLTTLLGSGIGEICVVTSRWFGGIKLGSGGLVRAYQDSVKECLATLPLREKRPMSRWRLELDYSFAGSLRRLLPELECTLESESYEPGPVFLLQVPENRKSELKTALDDMTRGSARLEQQP